MRRARWVALGALAYPTGVLVGHWLYGRSAIYPHMKPIPTHTPE